VRPIRRIGVNRTNWEECMKKKLAAALSCAAAAAACLSLAGPAQAATAQDGVTYTPWCIPGTPANALRMDLRGGPRSDCYFGRGDIAVNNNPHTIVTNAYSGNLTVAEPGQPVRSLPFGPGQILNFAEGTVINSLRLD
jgi:hypothetical protein